MTADDPNKAEVGEVADDLRQALAFLTRVPGRWFGTAQAAAPNLGRAARLFPLAGAIIGLAGGVVVALAAWLGLTPLVAISLAVATTVLLTGALHEDGLADTIDGFGGGRTAEQKLDIMDDSRIGTYGALALLFSVLLRVAALTAIAEAGVLAAALAFIAAESASRATMVRLWYSLPAARVGSLAETGGSPDDRAMLTALAVAGVIVLVTIIPKFGFMAAIVAAIVLGLAAYWFTRLASRQIGGRTGDTLGACQQFSVVAFLVALVPFA
jgi:adenosylcobinamide-GDP ribazoletransferase